MRTETVYSGVYFPWKARIRIAFDANKMSLSTVTKLLRTAGRHIGLGNQRGNGTHWGYFSVNKKSK